MTLSLKASLARMIHEGFSQNDRLARVHLEQHDLNEVCVLPLSLTLFPSVPLASFESGMYAQKQPAALGEKEPRMLFCEV